MEHILDYVRWYADLPFSILPFNEVDNLVLCGLSYWQFPQMDWTCGPHTLKACFEALQDKQIEMMTTDTDQTMSDFVRQAAQSKRFGTLLVSDYVDEFFPEVPIQFSAVTFHLDEGTRYIAFRGTDSSIAGWKEDFMISFTLTKSQEFAKQYLNTTLQPGMRYIIGGHSKGGNLAMYAIANLDPEKRSWIDHLYVLDAPGFAPDVFDYEKLKPLYGMTTRLMPEFAIISKIYEIDFPDTIIVESSGVATQQHDVITWQLYGPRFRLAEKNSAVSKAVMEVVMRWVKNESIEERKLFVNEIFDALRAGGATDITKVTGKGIFKVLEAFSNTSPQAKDVAMDLARVLINPNEAERREEDA